MLFYAVIINALLVAAAVTIHYEMLYRLARRPPFSSIKPRYRVLQGIFMILIAHVIEIWLFALGYFLMAHISGFGSLSGNLEHNLLDYSYFSFTTYTSLGLGDIEPSGHIRFLAGLESLTGLVMITWSASSLFLDMQKYWPKA